MGHPDPDPVSLGHPDPDPVKKKTGPDPYFTLWNPQKVTVPILISTYDIL